MGARAFDSPQFLVVVFDCAIIITIPFFTSTLSTLYRQQFWS